MGSTPFKKPGESRAFLISFRYSAFPQKVILGASVRLQAPSQRFAVATNFLRVAGFALFGLYLFKVCTGNNRLVHVLKNRPVFFCVEGSFFSLNDFEKVLKLITSPQYSCIERIFITVEQFHLCGSRPDTLPGRLTLLLCPGKSSCGKSIRSVHAIALQFAETKLYSRLFFSFIEFFRYRFQKLPNLQMLGACLFTFPTLDAVGSLSVALGMYRVVPIAVPIPVHFLGVHRTEQFGQ